MRDQRSGHTLEPTALVHEACVRLLGQSEVSWQSRAHFFAVAAKAMRQVLANHARGKKAAKRRPPGERVTLGEAASDDSGVDVDLLALDGALTELAAMDDRQSQLIELRFFGGMTIEEAAHVMGISTATAEREWRMARAWLSARLDDRGTEVRT
jgi:RNA polymerase sigma factor (TIGR02999 family)